MSGWRKYQTAEEMEIGRKYEYSSAFLPVLYERLNLEPNMKVADVGCGSGYFTRILANGLKEEGKIVGIDSDKTLISEAEKMARKEEIRNIKFKVGSIYKTSMPDEYADVVVCHILLFNIPRQFEAILEMKRIAKTGGKVVVIEPAGGGGIHYPDVRLNELFERFRRAFGTALDIEWRQHQLGMSSYIESIYLKPPQLFLKAGLTNLTLNGYLSTFLLCDARRNTEEIQRHLKARLDLWQKLKERNKECAFTGGMSEEEFEELFQRYADYFSSLGSNPKKIKQTAEVEIVSRVIVCGTKAQRNGYSP